jgi:flagellar biosynthetic protein FliR
MEHFATAQQVFAAGLLFARLGAMVMLMPAIGESFVPVRIRLAFSLALALMLFPIIAPSAPALPNAVSGVAAAIIKETLIGMLIGGILRFFMTSLATAGEVMSIQSTLGFAQTANPMQASPSTSIATFLGLMGLVLILVTNLHHLFIAAVVKSYTLFPFTRDVPLGDANTLAIQTVAKSFALGIQLSAPVIAFALIFNIATGLVGRVMPQFQIYFVSAPLMIILAMSLIALSMGVIGMVWIDHYRDLLSIFT